MGTRFSVGAGVGPHRSPPPCPEDETVGFICQRACLPGHQRLFYELCAYISLGVHRKVYFRRVLRIPGGQVIPV